MTVNIWIRDNLIRAEFLEESSVLKTCFRLSLPQTKCRWCGMNFYQTPVFVDFKVHFKLHKSRVVEFYHNIDRRRWLVWVEMTYFHRFFRTIHGVLALMDFSHPSHIGCSQSMASCWQGSSHPRKALIPWWSHEKILPMNFLRLLAVSMEHLNVTNYLQCGSSVE